MSSIRDHPVQGTASRLHGQANASCHWVLKSYPHCPSHLLVWPPSSQALHVLSLHVPMCMPPIIIFITSSQFQGSIKRAGSPVGNLTGGSVTYSNNLEKIETIRDDGLIEGADPTIAALTGRIDVRFADTTLVDLAAGGTPVDLEFAYTLSAQAKLVLTAHEVYLPKPKLAVEGPGGVQASFDFRGARNEGAGRMLTVTLTNDLDRTVYG